MKHKPGRTRIFKKCKDPHLNSHYLIHHEWFKNNQVITRNRYKGKEKNSGNKINIKTRFRNLTNIGQ